MGFTLKKSKIFLVYKILLFPRLIMGKYRKQNVVGLKLIIFQTYFNL